MELIEELGRHKQGSYFYKFGMFKCGFCNNIVKKIYRDGIRSRLCSHNCYAKNRTKRGGYKPYVINRKYKYIYNPGHPNAVGTNKTYVAEHRMVIEKHIGRYLTSGEIVHHINGNTIDNRIENLQIMTPSEHNFLHSIQRKRNAGRFQN